MASKDRNEQEKQAPAAGGSSAGKAPSRPSGAPKRVPGQNIEEQKIKQGQKDGGVDEDGRGRLTREND